MHDAKVIYGPGELETFRHLQLQEAVKRAKLKVYYPGRWARHSPRAWFRVRLDRLDTANACFHGVKANDDIAADNSLFNFRSNARIISASLVQNIEALKDGPTLFQSSVPTSKPTSVATSEIPTQNQVDLRWESTVQENTEQHIYDHTIFFQSVSSVSTQNEMVDEDTSSPKSEVKGCFLLVLELDTRPAIDEKNKSISSKNAKNEVPSLDSQTENNVHDDKTSPFDLLAYPPPCIILQSSASSGDSSEVEGSVQCHNLPDMQEGDNHKLEADMNREHLRNEPPMQSWQRSWHRDHLDSSRSSLGSDTGLTNPLWEWKAGNIGSKKIGVIDDDSKSRAYNSEAASLDLDEGGRKSTRSTWGWRPILSYWSPSLTALNKFTDKSSHSSSGSEKGMDPFSILPHQMSLHHNATIPPVGQIGANHADNNSNTEETQSIVYDFGRELLGKVQISVPQQKLPIKFFVGETLVEAMNEDEAHFEQSLELFCAHENDNAIGSSGTDVNTFNSSDGRDGTTMPNQSSGAQNVSALVDREGEKAQHVWISAHLLAFRFVRLVVSSDTDLSGIRIVCQMHLPFVTRHGSFSCTDLNETESFTSSRDIGTILPLSHPKETASDPPPEHWNSEGMNSQSQNLDTQIWHHAAYTLQLSFHQSFIVDGIKRDRLPWAGDLAVSLMANAYSFRDEEHIRWTLTILGRCGMDRIDELCGDNKGDQADDSAIKKKISESHVNGIVDYSLWFVISHWLYQRYFEDSGFLQQEWELIQMRLNALLRYGVDPEKGFLNLDEDDWIFIDWTEEKEKHAAVQILWWWALECASELGDKIMSLTECNESTNSENNFLSLVQRVQSQLEDSFMEMEDIQKGFTIHAHVLGCLSGLYSRLDDRASEGDWSNPDCSDRRWKISRRCRQLYERSRDVLLLGGSTVGTPFMKHMEVLALSRLGDRIEALTRLRKYWGGMLNNDFATTFFEAFGEQETIDEVCQFYDRPFARSLCHAWGAGPCSLLPEILLGLRPVSDGWKEWVCDPLIDCASSVSAEVLTSFGTISVHLKDQLKVHVPEGTTMILMKKKYCSGVHSFSRNILISTQTAKRWSTKYRGWHYHPTHVIPPNPEIPGYENIRMTDVPTVYQIPGRNDTFVMCFIGFDGVGYQSFVAESSDLLTWSKYKIAMGYGEEGMFDYGGVVLGAFLYESYKMHEPRVLKKINGKFYSLYGAYAKRGTYEPDPGYQGLASSEDGLSWRREKDESILSVLGPGSVGLWESASIYQPWLMEHKGMYYNFYNAKQMPQWIEQIGLATSNDLYEWTRHAENPVLPVGTVTDASIHGGFDTQFASDPKVFLEMDYEQTTDVGHDVGQGDDSRWVMFFFGVGRGGAHIMIGYSKDLIHWSNDAVPLYSAGGNPSGLDKQYAHKVSLVWNPKNTTWYLFYCAVGDAGRGIGLLTSKKL